MLTVRNGSSWNLLKQLYVRNGGSWQEAKELYVRDSGSWKKIYNRNYFPSAGYQHPYWQYNMCPDFSFNDNGLCYTTFWSTSGATYNISGGVGSIYINTMNIGTTTDSTSQYSNTTNGSTTVVLKDTAPLQPVTRTNVNGGTVKWLVTGTNIQSNTYVNSINSSTEITISKPATGTGSGLILDYNRTWNSSYYGVTRLQGQVPLYVSPGQNWTLSAAPTAGTTNSSWKFGIVTAPTSAGADFFGTGANIQESSQYFDLTARGWTASIPSGHYYMRPMITIDHSAGSYPTVMPRYYSFNYFYVTRGSG